MQILNYGSAVVTFIGHDLFDAPQVDLRLFRRRRRYFMLNQLRYRFARLRQRLVNRRRVSLIGSL